MKKVISICVLALLCSCNTVKTYYQVYNTESETVKSSGNSIFFEDANCIISYNLWSENGNAGFSFYNKTEELIYLQLDQSFYVINGNAYDYYQNRVFISSSNSATVSSNTSGYSLLGRLSYTSLNSKTVTSHQSKGLEITEAKVIAIPSKTTKSISEFNINETIFRDCDLLRFPSSKQVSQKSFNKENSPLKFYNSISYKIGDKINKVKNDFYVSGITNIASSDAFKQEKNAFCNQKGGGTIDVFKEIAPNKFYIIYTKTQADTWKY